MRVLSYVLVFLIGGLVSYCGTEYFKSPCPEYVEVKADSIKTKIEAKEKEVEVLKEKKKGISYTTSFKGFKPLAMAKDTMDKHTMANHGQDCDTMAQVIYVELLKCDSMVKIDDVIIANQDTIIADQKKVISIVEADNGKLKKEVKKQKRKTLLTKIGSGIVIVAVILLK